MLYVFPMVIGERLRELREAKKLSQGDIEKRTGLLRCYTSRVECGHTIPSLETLEKYAHALKVPMYQLFYEGEAPPKLPELPRGRTGDGLSKKDSRVLQQFRILLEKMSKKDLVLLFSTAEVMASRARRTREHREGKL
jgi:transcriptional regulator with XRE-family HTH domain